jgi:outer membrane lipoprotein
MRALLITATLLALSGCATVPKPLAGEYGSASPRDNATEGNRVRWGGAIITVEPREQHTCFQILGRELDATGRPRRPNDSSEGRFLACRSGFYDPAIFDKGRELTITGTVTGSETIRVGEYDLRVPHVDADVVYLWPERYSFDEYYQPYPAFYWDPFFGAPLVRYHHYPRRHHHRNHDGGHRD